MSEILVILDDEQLKAGRLQRAGGLAGLFKPENKKLLESLKSFLLEKKHDALLRMKSDDARRHTAHGVYDMADGLIETIQTEVREAVALSKPPDEGEPENVI